MSLRLWESEADFTVPRCAGTVEASATGKSAKKIKPGTVCPPNL
jgi:hypothetical protein